MSKRVTFLKERRVLGVVMAAIMVMSMFAIAIVSCTEKAYAKPAIEITRVDLTVKPIKCGTPVTVEGTEGEYDDEVQQTPTPEITVETTGIELFNGDYAPDQYPLFWNSDKIIMWPNYMKIADLFTGKIKEGADCWIGVGFYEQDGYDLPYDYSWDEESGTETYTPKYDVYVNGKKVDVNYKFSGNNEIRIKLNSTMIEHDWDEGKVSGDTKTYTCKGCGATKTEKIPSASSTPLLTKMTSKGANAISFSWDKVAGATGYEIYLSRCNYSGKEFTPKKVKTIKGNKTTKWTKKGLKKGVPYKGYVKAYKMENGKKTYISKTPTVHVFTNGGNKKYTNPKSVSVKKTSVSLAAGKTFKIKASVKKLKAGKKLLNTKHAPKLRYVSSDKNVATVNGSGTITAKAAGKCKVYAIAANGAKKAIAVAVK